MTAVTFLRSIWICLAGIFLIAPAQAADTYKVGIRQIEFADTLYGAQLAIIPGDVDHEIFVNECDQEGRDEFPEACIDAPGVDRHAIHNSVGQAALKFLDENLSK
jgi:hypothetical protein